MKEQQELDNFFEEYLKKGRIWSSNLHVQHHFFVKKKDSSLRLVQDYWWLNKVTIKKKYPLLLIQELVNKIKGANYFTKINIQWGYNNVRIREGDEWKAAFRTNSGLFKLLVIYFRLCNLPATFQLIIDSMLWELVNTGKVIVYIDNILIFTKTIEEHHNIVNNILVILERNKLTLQSKKYQFHKTKIDYLGVIISRNSVEVNPTTIKGVTEWPKPKDKQEFWQFLEFCNFYRYFIKGFAHITKPLTKLTGKRE